MINNRQNGRRRGRGGQQPRNGQPGVPDRGNRLDNRARGNAAQLLEKYKSLARDAQMAGDRVNTEYYLQFADHYFRILAETRSRFDEQRPQARQDYRDDMNGDDMGDEGEGNANDRVDARPYGVQSGNEGGWSPDSDEGGEQPRYEQRPRYEQQPRNDQARYEQPPRNDRNDQTRGDQGRGDQARGDQARGDQQRNDQPRNDQQRYEPRPRNERRPAEAPEAVEPAPVTRDEGERYQERRPRREDRAEQAPRSRARQEPRVEAAPAPAEAEPEERIEIDRLPAGFGTAPASDPANDAEEVRPRRRTRRPRADTADSAEA